MCCLEHVNNGTATDGAAPAVSGEESTSKSLLATALRNCTGDAFSSILDVVRVKFVSVSLLRSNEHRV